jgi:hypothetical protein
MITGANERADGAANAAGGVTTDDTVTGALHSLAVSGSLV